MNKKKDQTHILGFSPFIIIVGKYYLKNLLYRPAKPAA